MKWPLRLRRPTRESQRYISQDILLMNQQMLNNIFRVNEQVVQILALLEPHAANAAANQEIRRLSAFRDMAIEFAGWLYADEGDLLQESVLTRFGSWLDAQIEIGRRNGLDESSIAGYRVLAEDLCKRQFGVPKTNLP